MARLLLVDDDADFLRWEAALLAAEGHQVTTASSGAEALASLAAARPDLVLLDILMPDIDGRLLHDQIRGVSEVPVVFVSVTRAAGEAVLRGACGFVTKPIEPGRLIESVRQVLGSDPDPGSILVVDDDPDIRTLFSTLLSTSGGYSVDEASDGRAALERLERGPRVGLVIADVHMPLMNGLELVRALRADPRWRELPVIVQTSDDLIARSNTWVELDVEQVMRKDDFLRWLLATVRKYAAPDAASGSAPGSGAGPTPGPA